MQVTSLLSLGFLFSTKPTLQGCCGPTGRYVQVLRRAPSTQQVLKPPPWSSVTAPYSGPATVPRAGGCVANKTKSLLS